MCFSPEGYWLVKFIETSELFFFKLWVGNLGCGSVLKNKNHLELLAAITVKDPGKNNDNKNHKLRGAYRMRILITKTISKHRLSHDFFAYCDAASTYQGMVLIAMKTKMYCNVYLSHSTLTY